VLSADKNGWALSERALFVDVLRAPNRDKVSEGRPVALATERDIFEYLGLVYRTPAERNA